MTQVYLLGIDPSLRELLVFNLSKEIDLSGYSENFRDHTRSLITKLQPDILICSSDLFRNENSPGKIIFEASQMSHVLIILDPIQTGMAHLLMKMKIMGMILKSEIPSYLNCCIAAIESGGVFLSPKIKDLFTDEPRKKDFNKEKRLERLTDREKEIAKLILDFKSNKEISKKLFISYQTVKNHRYQIMQKFQLNGRGKLLPFLIENRDGLGI